MARTRLSDVRPVIESRLRVRYKDTDQMGIAHHSNHVVWFEIGRTDLCRAAGIEYKRIEELGWILVVTEIGCRYRGPLHGNGAGPRANGSRLPMAARSI